MNNYEIHPAANVFPVMDEESFQLLKADIEKNGQCEAVVLHDGKLVDGRHRLRACRELGIDPLYSELGPDADPVAFILSANLHRRHLRTSQRALCAARLVNLKQGRPSKEKGQNCTFSVKQSAKAFGVSERSVKTAAEAMRCCDEATIAKIEWGDLAVSKAVADVRRAQWRAKCEDRGVTLKVLSDTPVMLFILSTNELHQRDRRHLQWRPDEGIAFRAKHGGIGYSDPIPAKTIDDALQALSELTSAAAPDPTPEQVVEQVVERAVEQPVEPEFSPCPYCGCRTRDENGDCAKCKDPCENGVQPVDHDDADDQPENSLGYPPEADTLIEAHAQPWDRWSDWRVAVANVAKCCTRVAPGVVADCLEDLAADIRRCAK